MPSSAQATQGLARNPAAPFDVLSQLLEARPDDACAGLRRRDELARPLREAVATHSSRHVRATLAGHPGVDPDVRERLLSDPEWSVWTRAFDRPGQRPVSDGAVVRLLSHTDRLPDVPFTRDEMSHELVDCRAIPTPGSARASPAGTT